MKNTFEKIWKVISKQKAVLAIILMMVFMAFQKTSFYTPANWLEMLRSAAILEIIAFGVTVSVICGGCDLSVGGTLCLGGISCIMFMNAGLPVTVAIILAILIGAFVGFINGFLIVQQHTEPFIITLGMGILLKGICQQLTNAHPLKNKNLDFMNVANFKVGSVPGLVVIMVVLGVLFYCLLRFTSFGRNCYAIGGNYDVAKYSGIKVVPIKWTAYVLSGTMATIAGILLASRLNSGSSVYGDSTGMSVNCGCVIGGTSFAGGEGGIVQSFIGIFVMQMITNVMTLMKVDGYVQKLVTGLVIVLIIGMDCFGRKLKRERV